MQPSSMVEILYLLITATCVVWLFRRFKLPAILAYLLAGVIVGADGLNLVNSADDVHFFAELGIVFLLFTLGLEFSLPKLIAMRFLVFGVGSAQVAICLAVFMGGALFFDIGSIGALAVGGTLALSSTAIVIKQLQESDRIGSKRGQLAVSVLLFQDIAVVPLLIVIPLLAHETGEGLLSVLLLALFKGGLIVVLLLATGKWVLPKLFDEIASARTDELFVLTTLLVAVLAGLLTYSFGLSMALGAFLAGMMLGESQYRHQLEADIRPFRDILMGLFFITIGMALKLSVLIEFWHVIFAGMLAMMITKTVVIYTLAKVAGQRRKDAWSAGLMLSQMGEFGFVIVALAFREELIDYQTSSILIGIGVFSMALTPFLVHRANAIALVLTGNSAMEIQPEMAQTQQRVTAMTDHVLIGGFGRVGQTVARFLAVENVPYVAVDGDPMRVQEASAAGENILFGDMRQKEILEAAGLEQAKLVILCFSDARRAIDVVKAINIICPNKQIVVRTRDDRHLTDLNNAGVKEVVPEMLEGSLMLVSHVMHLVGVPMSRILRRVAQERKNHYNDLHGFYPGQNIDMNSEKREHLQFLHAVTLPDDAYAVGYSIDELALADKRVEVYAIKRDGQDLEVQASDLVFAAQDVIVLKGKPRRVERTERFLLDGH